MKLSNAFAILTDMRFAIQQAFLPTLMEVLRTPSMLFRPRELSWFFFSKVWDLFGDGLNENGRAVKEELIPRNAYGVVLDLGAGHGHTALYLSRTRVTKYIALEPNVLMHPHIKAKAAAAGFSEDEGTFMVLSCGAEQVSTIVSALGGRHEIDTLISIITLCSVPRPEETVRGLVEEVLKPGGQLLFYEHVASRRDDVRSWQTFWTRIWKVCFDGCELDRPTDGYIRRIDVWEAYPGEDGSGGRIGIWGKEGEGEEHLFWHQIGRLIKRAG